MCTFEIWLLWLNHKNGEVRNVFFPFVAFQNLTAESKKSWTVSCLEQFHRKQKCSKKYLVRKIFQVIVLNTKDFVSLVYIQSKITIFVRLKFGTHNYWWLQYNVKTMLHLCQKEKCYLDMNVMNIRAIAYNLFCFFNLLWYYFIHVGLWPCHFELPFSI